MIGFSLGIGVGGGGRLRFLPSAIFTASEPGAWYDPSDLTTLFQDSAGTTPVTAPAQTVGLMLDKSQGLVLGSELVTNGDFSGGSTGWTFAGTLPNITISGGVASFAASTGNRWLVQNGILTVGKSYQITATVTVSAGTIGPDINGFSGNVSSSGTYTWRITNVTLTQFQLLANNSFVGTVDNISVKLLPGNHATQATLAQRPTYGVDGTGRPYLSFDGVDDGMVTGTITPGIDKVQVFAGIRRISDANTGMLAEFSPALGSNAGSWHMLSPAGTGVAGSGFASKGTVQAANNTVSPAAPITEILTGLGDISGDVNTFRKNGVATSNLNDQGTGNFLPYVLYIGRRNGASLAMNSRIYSLIVRFGANLTAGQIASTELYVNLKTGAY